jgi:hypothetical protein
MVPRFVRAAIRSTPIFTFRIGEHISANDLLTIAAVAERIGWLERLNKCMGAVLDFAKLAELHARTDADLVSILNADLDRGLALANVAASKRSVFRSQAEAVYTRAKLALPRLGQISEQESASLERKVKELGMALDLVAGTMDLEAAPACF